MSAAITEMERLGQEQRDKWEMIGATPVRERNVARLPQFKKDFPKGTEVRVRDPKSGVPAPFLLRSGRVLLVEDCLPERADLCLDKHGIIVDQREFADRYALQLESYVTPAHVNRNDEPVPNVERYLNAKPDTWTASKGYVEIDYDPFATGTEFKPKFYVDQDGNQISVEEHEAKESEREARADKMEALLVALGEKVLAPEDIAASPEADAVPTIGETQQETQGQDGRKGKRGRRGNG